jgi:hypothetical protein
MQKSILSTSTNKLLSVAYVWNTGISHAFCVGQFGSCGVWRKGVTFKHGQEPRTHKIQEIDREKYKGLEN